MADELWRKGAGELAAGITAGTYSATQVVAAHLERIAEVNPSLNAVVADMSATATELAADADKRLAAGEALGPLGGVPITIKENIDAAGTATTQGMPALAEAIPAQDAPIVERVLAAGAIPIGRTNLPEMGLRLHTDNALRGLTRNPWDLGRTTGGSSGGEGAALASGMSPIGLGNDIGGSLRNPAHCCGIASIKPTQGVVPGATTIPAPEAPIGFQLMASDGPMARRVSDVRLGLDVLQGKHPRDPNSMSAVFTTVDRPVRIAVMAEPPGGDNHAGISDVVRAAASALDSAGCHVVETDAPAFEAVIENWSDLVNNDVLLGRPMLDPMLSEDAITFLDDFNASRPELSIETYAGAWVARGELAKLWSAFFTEYDMVLSPTWTQMPFEHGWDVAQPGRAPETMRHARCVMPGNSMGLPSACVPAGMVDGMPVGVLLTGGRFSDYLCLDAAEIIEAASDVETPIDPRG